MALTAQQRAFIEAYLGNGMMNAAAAYREAYPSKKRSAHEDSVEAQRLLAHPLISPLVQEANVKAAERLVQAVDRFAVSKERISAALARIAFSDARRLFSWSVEGVRVLDSETLSDDDAAAVVEVSHTVTAEGGTIRVKVGDKRAALMDLAKLHGMVVDRVEAKVSIETPDDTRPPFTDFLAEFAPKPETKH